MKLRFSSVVLVLAVLAATVGGTAGQGSQPPRFSLPPEPPRPPEARPFGGTESGQTSPAPPEVSGVSAAEQAYNVELVGQLGGATYAVAVQGDYAYIGVGPRLVVLNVADPARPMVVGQSAVLPGIVHGVALAGNYAYVAAEYAGLRIVDVSDPAAPQEVGFYDTPGAAFDVALAGHYAYVADYEAGLRIVDVSNPTAPQEVGFYDTPGVAQGVGLAGNYAYVADWDGGLAILRLVGYRLYLPLIPRTH